MYSNFMVIVYRVLGSGLAKHLVWMVPVIAAFAAVMLCLPAWRRRERAAAEGEARFGVLTLLLAAAFRLAVAGTVVGFLAAALLVQSRLFAEKHGRVTQRNYNAVKTKWGVPHEQYDLRVRHYVMRKVIEEELANGSTRRRKLAEWQPATNTEDRIVLNDERFAPPTDEQERKARRWLARRTTTLVRHTLEQDSIETAEADITLRSNPRKLGGAIYAGYDDTWKLAYTVANRSRHTTQACFRFPLPDDGYGLFDRLTVKLDGKDWIPQIRYTSGSLEWRTAMEPGQTHAVEIGYASRGLEHFRYKPGSMRERCVVTVHVEGIDAKRLNFPIGSMPPRDDLKTLTGSTYDLHWDLSRAVSNLDIGIIVPTATQPGYHITCLLEGAPVALALLGLTLFLSRGLLTRRFDLLPVCLVLVAFYIAHALLANLNDVVTSFPVAFAASMFPITAAVVLFWRQIDGVGFLATQSSVLVVLFSIVYPLGALGGDASGTLLHILYAVLVLYVIGLVAATIGRTSAPEPSPA